MSRVAVVGVGYIGTCLSAVLAERGVSVVGIDTDRALIADLSAGRCRVREPGLAETLVRLAGSVRLSFTTDYDAVTDVEVIVITVGTPVDAEGKLLTRQLRAVCRQLSTRLRPGQLVIVRSTVAPGITRNLVVPLLEVSGLTEGEDLQVAYSPERLAEGKALAQLNSLPVVVGGCSEASAATAARFWQDALNVPVHVVGTVDVAEIVKLATNWWIDANVALANELARFCATFGVDVLEVISSANALPKGSGNVNFLLPSVGVGGACLTKDPWMTWQAARSRGLCLETIETARRVNDGMPEYAHHVLTDAMLKLGKDPAAATVAVLGLAFKSDTGDLRHTPVSRVVVALRKVGAEVRLFDPLADREEIEAVFGQRPVADLEEAVRGADAIAVLAGHQQFADIDLERLQDQVSMPCLIFDGRMYYPSETVRHLRSLGFEYCGIGR